MDGSGYADSIAASPLAHYLKAPILFVKKGADNKSLMNKIKRLGAKNSYIVGGENSVNKDFESSISKSLNTNRISAESRYSTSVKIANELEKLGAKFDTVYLANGMKFTDAVTISTLATQTNAPVILVQKESLPENISEFSSFNSK